MPICPAIEKFTNARFTHLFFAYSVAGRISKSSHTGMMAYTFKVSAFGASLLHSYPALFRVSTQCWETVCFGWANFRLHHDLTSLPSLQTAFDTYGVLINE